MYCFLPTHFYKAGKTLTRNIISNGLFEYHENIFNPLYNMVKQIMLVIVW